MKTNLLVLVFATLLTVSASAQELKVDAPKSVLKWNGKKVGGEHYGKITLKEGSLKVNNDKIENGVFVIDMNTITSDDLPAGDLNASLVGHLKSDDFFGVEKHPEATLEIINSTTFVNGKATVTGNLTIKGITNKVVFDVTREGYFFSTLVTVDRSLYNVRYGSGKFFANLGDKTINDEFTLDVKLVMK